MLCAHCSNPVSNDARFCQTCGSQVSDAEGQARINGSIDEPALQRIEQQLGDETRGVYYIERLIGRGGMALVYLATEISLARKVAIKVLPPELIFSHGIERFVREARTAAALVHPHIIPIYRVASSGNLFWYAMTYLEGQSLEELLKEKQRLTLDQTVAILTQVADALDYAHANAVVHRDIKPANVMLDARGRVMITDFGIAKPLSEGALTASGSILGTPYYMSPEQATGRPVTGAADQYSVAVLAFRMLSGEVPFDGDSGIEILSKHCMTDPPPLDFLVDGLPDSIVRAVHRGLAKTAGERFATVADFVRALNPAPAPSRVGTTPPPGSGSDVPTVQVPPPAPQSPRQVHAARRRVWMSGFVSLLVVGAVAVVMTLIPEDQSRVGAGGTPPPTSSSAFPNVADSVTPGVAAQTAPSRPPEQVPEKPKSDSTMGAAGRPVDRVSSNATIQRDAPAAPQRRAPEAQLPLPVTGSPAHSDTGRGVVLRIIPMYPAFIWIDSIEMGERTNATDTVRSGSYRIRVVKAGFLPVDSIVHIGATDTLRIVRIPLQRRPS